MLLLLLFTSSAIVPVAFNDFAQIGALRDNVARCTTGVTGISLDCYTIVQLTDVLVLGSLGGAPI